jgi:hypothetical protein
MNGRLSPSLGSFLGVHDVFADATEIRSGSTSSCAAPGDVRTSQQFLPLGPAVMAMRTQLAQQAAPHPTASDEQLWLVVSERVEVASKSASLFVLLCHSKG